jgi:hypothetical protein
MSKIPKSWLVFSLKKSHLVLGMTIGDITQEQAHELTDGPDGWSILKIVCHLRDYQELFIERVRRMVEEDRPVLTAYDAAAREALVTQNRYAEQNLRAVFEDYGRVRHDFILQNSI